MFAVIILAAASSYNCRSREAELINENTSRLVRMLQQDVEEN